MSKKLSATTAGSLPKPKWLAEPEKLWPQWKIKKEDLWEGQKKSVLQWIQVQESAGLDIITEGEQFRIHFVHGFLQKIKGISWNQKTKMGIRNNRYTVEVPTVTEAIIRPEIIHLKEAEFLRKNTKKKTKFTLPGPMTICDTIANNYYQTREEMAFAFAQILNIEAKALEKAGIDIIQFDEPAFNSFNQETINWGVKALETAIEGLKCKTAVHVCYGYGIKENINWKQTLGDQWLEYKTIFPSINDSNINQVSLEFSGSKVSPELMLLLPDKEIMVGVVTVVSDVIETAEEVENNILSALKFVDRERLIPSSNCGMAPLSTEIAIAKLKALGNGTQLINNRN
jgi:5-methyltetrahydropteroyltriglutamate--homocysteine methyltransferase